MATIEGNDQGGGWFNLSWGSSSTAAGKSTSIQELKNVGGTETQNVDHSAQSVFKYKGSGWMRSAIQPGTEFRVEVKGNGQAGFGTLKTVDNFSKTLILSQPGDNRRPLGSATLVSRGVRPQTLTVKPGGTSIEKSYGNPIIDDVVFNFFLGDSTTPVPVFNGNDPDPVVDYTFNPVCKNGAREGRIQSLVVRAETDKAGSVVLRLFTQVDPTCGDCVGDTASSCWNGTGASLRFAGSVVTGAVRGTGTALTTLASSVRHPVLTAQSLRARTIVALGGQLPAVEEKKEN